MARQKKTIITGVSREQADEAFAKYAKSDAQIQKINAEIELQCAKIREKYADKLASLGDDRQSCSPRRRASTWHMVPSASEQAHRS